MLILFLLQVEPFLLGWNSEMQKKFEQAIECYKKSNPILEPHALYHIARCYKYLGKYNEAINFYKILKSKYPNFVRISNAMEELAFCYTKLKEYDLAIKVWENEFLPPKSWYNIAKIYEIMNKPADSIYIKIAIQFTNSKEAYNIIDKLPKDSAGLIGKIYYFNNEYTKAIKYLMNVNGCEEYLCWSLYKIGEYTKAESLAKVNSLWFISGKCNEMLGKYELAIEYFRKSSEPDAFFFSAELLGKLNKLDEAIYNYLSVPKNNKFYEIANLRAGLIAMNLGYYNIAKNAFMNLSGPQSYYWCYKVCQKMNSIDTSIYKEKLVNEYPISYYTAKVLEKEPFVWESEIIRNKIIEDKFEKYLNDDYSDEEYNNFLRGKLLLELGITQEASLEFRQIVNYSLLWKVAKLCDSIGATHLSIYYANKLKNVKPVSEYYTILFPLKYYNEITAFTKDIDQFLIMALMRQESYFNPNAVSRSNAIGLMQILPKTGKKIAKELKVKKYDLFNEETSIKFGAYYINYCLNEFNENVELFLAAYNGGPHNVKKWIKERKPNPIDEWVEWIPFKETRDYVKKVIEGYFAYDILYGKEYK